MIRSPELNPVDPATVPLTPPKRAIAQGRSEIIALEVRGLRQRYGRLEALHGLDFEVYQGEIFGLIGPDGAGKTTTFEILAGVREATAGKALALGLPPREARLAIGYLTQQFSLYLDLSIDENLRYSAGLRQVPPGEFQQRRAKYLQLMGLEAFGDRLAGQLSGGMKQKLALCCALVSQPQILLLDEPTTGVDPVSRREFWDVLAALAHTGVTIVVATPYLDEAERCHRVALMYGGQIQQLDTPARLRTRLGLERLEVVATDLAQAEAALLAVAQPDAEGIVDVQTFGDRLDVLVRQPQRGETQVRQILAQQHLPLQRLVRAAPTLENVFVTHLRQLGSDPPLIPLPRSPRADRRPAPEQRSRSNPPLAIAARNLQKQFGAFAAVRGVDLAVRYGEIYGLLGANGAGKTTTIKMLCGLLQPSGGQVSLAGKQQLRHPRLRQRLGYMSQKFTLYDDLSVVQNLEFYSGIYGIPRRWRQAKIDWVLAICGLEGQGSMLTGQLPGGWKQRVAFGAAVMHEPEILFLDEPTSGVDPLARRQFWRLIEAFARAGTAILVTTHYLEEAEHCHHLGLMVAGRVVVQGSPQQLKAAQPGQLLELVTDHPQAASDLLKSRLDFWRVSMFGDRLHLVLDAPDRDLPQVRSLLAEAGLEIHSLQPIEFSLEDAFIGVVQRSQPQER